MEAEKNVEMVVRQCVVSVCACVSEIWFINSYCDLWAEKLLFLNGFCISATLPSQRVASILGRDEDEEDEFHQTHDIFCEMEELRPVGDDGELEWKETARLGYIAVSIEAISS